MGEYTGRRRGRPAGDEPQHEPQYVETPSYEEGYFADEGYGYEAPSYEPYTYEEPQRPHSRRGQPSPEEEMYAPEYGYTEQQYTETYYNGEYYEEYTEEYVEGYAEPRYEPRRRSEDYQPEYAPDYQPEYAQEYQQDYAPDYQPGYAQAYPPEYPQDYAPDYPADHPPEYAPQPHPARQALPLTSHLPFIALSTAALIAASFVSAKAVAAVVLPLQLLVAWAVLDLAGHKSRRTAVLTALPTLAATVGTFKFQADESATAIAGGLGAGFFLLAADAVFRARRRGVEPGTVRAVAAAASALLFAGLTGLFLPAARLESGAVAVGAAAGALVALAAARNPELGSSRVVVVAVPATAAALASYAAAILLA